MISKWFLLRQRMYVSDEATLLSNSIPKDFAKIILCLRDMTNLAEIFERT